MPGIKPGWELQGLVKEDTFTGLIPPENYYDSLDEAGAEFIRIMEESKATVTLLEKYGQPKTLADRIFIFLDDQVGSKLLKSKWFSGFITRHRHHSASIMIGAQAYKEIARTVRTALMCGIFYKIGNEMEVRCIYEEFSMGLKFKPWLAVYKAATKEKHDFMFVDYQKDEEKDQIYKNFDHALTWESDDEDEGHLNKKTKYESSEDGN